MTELDRHHAANQEQVRLLREALAAQAPRGAAPVHPGPATEPPDRDHEAPPAWLPALFAAIWSLGLLGQWLVWHDLGVLLLFGLLGLLISAAGRVVGGVLQMKVLARSVRPHRDDTPTPLLAD